MTYCCKNETGEIQLSRELERLQELIGYQFLNRNLLLQAVTHRSFSHEQGTDLSDYERLEFLGDAVLNLCLSLALIQRFPARPEGELTQMRASLVSEQTLARMARDIGLGACLRLGRGEEHTGGRERNSILADAYEAILGAVFLDGGFDRAQQAVTHLFRQSLEEVDKDNFRRDFKTEIQQWIQERFRVPPEYVVTHQWGPPHQRGFRVEVRLQGTMLGSGRGLSKKEAEQAAARDALERLQPGSASKSSRS